VKVDGGKKRKEGEKLHRKGEMPCVFWCRTLETYKRKKKKMGKNSIKKEKPHVPFGIRHSRLRKKREKGETP
jgi:hypothetical protein